MMSRNSSEQKVVILYLQLFCKFEISKLFKNNFKVSHIYTNYITFCLIDSFATILILKMHICCNTIATNIWEQYMSINGISHLLTHNFVHEEHPKTDTHTHAHTSNTYQRPQVMGTPYT